MRTTPHQRARINVCFDLIWGAGYSWKWGVGSENICLNTVMGNE